MERLVKLREDNWKPNEFSDYKDFCSDFCHYGCKECPIQECFNKLAAYQETGLTPERCAKLAKAEDEGRLAIAPRAVGGLLWSINHWMPTMPNWLEIISFTDAGVYCKNHRSFMPSLSETWAPQSFVTHSDIGETVFLTREEAIKALEGEV